MANKSRFILVIIFTAVLFLTSCAGQPVAPPEHPPAEQVITPEPSPPEQEEIIDPQPEPEYEYEEIHEEEERVPTIATAAAQIYYDFFSSSFEIIEYVGIHGPWQLWGHRLAGELRLTTMVSIYLIENFDDPVLIFGEFTLKEDGVNISYGLLNAYLIRDGELCSYLSRAEFDMIFSVIDDGERRRGAARYRDEVVHNVEINGERLFLFDFAGLGISMDEYMDMLLDMLREHL